MGKENNTELEAQNILQLEANSKLESIEKNTESTLLEVSKTKDVLNNLEPVLESIVVNTAPKEIQKIEIVGFDFSTLKGPKGDKGDDSTVAGPKGDKGADSTVAGPKGDDSTVEGPKGDKGADSTVAGPKGDKGADSTVEGPRGDKGDDGSPDTPENIVEKLNTLTRQLNWKVLKDIPENLGGKGGGAGFLREISDVEILTQPNNNQTLSWDSLKQRWTPKTPSGGDLTVFIRRDGTSTTTAPIPFALGLTSADNVTIDDGIQSKFLTVGNVGTLGQGFFAALYKKDRITFSVDDTENVITDTILHTSGSIYTFSSTAIGIGSFTFSPLKFSFTSTASSPPAFIFCGADGTGTNQNGQTLQLSSGRSTGTGTANVAIFAAPSGASGAAFNTATAVATFSTAAMTLAEAVNIVTGTTTGTRIGSAANQRIGIWGATPIVQPTTSVAAATFVANTSGIANDTATFDGYTLGKVVKALRNMGILA